VVSEQSELIEDLKGLARESAVQRATSVVSRAQRLLAHLIILKYISERQGFFYRRSRLKRMLRDLPDLFHKAEESSGLACCEFPNMHYWRRGAESSRFWEIPRVRRRHIDEVLSFLSETIPPLLDTMTFSSSSSFSTSAADISPLVGSTIHPSHTSSSSFFSSKPSDTPARQHSPPP